MKICVLTDFDLRGSGYKNLTVPLLDGLATNGHDIKVAGLQYDGSQHDFPFSLIPARTMADAVAIVKNLEILWKFDVLIVLLDIPIQEQLLNAFQTRTFKYVGVFPIEAPPLCMEWAMTLLQMDKAFVISEFGAKAAKEVGVDAEHLQIGIDTEVWKAPTPEEKQKIRKALGVDDETFVILTVADNQERKNLSRAMEIVADFVYDYYPVSQAVIKEKDLRPIKKVQYNLVTREHFWGGWKIRSHAEALGISMNLSVYERGMSFQDLWGLYAVSDAFLLTSKTEGLGMPVLEAMAMKVPVIGTDFAGIGEHLDGGKRGVPIDYYDYPDFDPYTDPFGNGLRVFAKRQSGMEGLKFIQDFGVENRIENAFQYVKARTHQISVDQLENALQGLYED